MFCINTSYLWNKCVNQKKHKLGMLFIIQYEVAKPYVAGLIDLKNIYFIWTVSGKLTATYTNDNIYI